MSYILVVITTTSTSMKTLHDNHCFFYKLFLFFYVYLYVRDKPINETLSR